MGDRADPVPPDGTSVVRVLDAASPSRESVVQPWPRRLSVVAVAGAAAVLFAIPTGPEPSSELEAIAAPPLVGSEAPWSSPGYAVAGSVEAFEVFVKDVNSGDVDGVLAALAEDLPALGGVGAAQWPYLPSDAGWWVDGVIEPDRVEGFVQYVFNVPGSVSVSDCTAWEHGPVLVVATCTYVASGGALVALGQEAEQGQLSGMMIGDHIVGVTLSGDVDVELWRRLATWAEEAAPDRLASVVTFSSEGWTLGPATYTGFAARAQSRLAEAMAVDGPDAAPSGSLGIDWLTPRHPNRPPPALQMTNPFPA